MLVIDAITLGEGRRDLTRDFIGAGPRMVTATLRACNLKADMCRGEAFLAASASFARNHDACLVSGMSMDKPSIIAIARGWKRVKPAAPVIVGGPVALEPVSLLRNKEIDAVVVGEAETILFAAFSKQGLPDFSGEAPEGFFTRQSIQAISTPGFDVASTARWPSLPWVEQHVDPAIDCLKAYDNFWAARVYVETLRGCSNYARSRIGPGDKHVCKDCGYCDTCGEFDASASCIAGIKPGCGFCSTAAISGPIRSFSTPYIVNQVGQCIDLGCHRIVLGGSDILEFHREALFKAGRTRPVMPPAPNHDALSELVDRLLGFEQVRRGEVQLFAENIKASLSDDESLSILARLPGISVSIGVETGSDKQLVDIGKSTTIATIKHAVQLLNKHRIRFHAYFIHSLPGQTAQTVQDSVNMMKWLEDNQAEKITMYRFKPLPGSAFERHRVTNAMLDDAEPMVAEALRINEAGKEKYIGAMVKVLIAEHDFRDRQAAIGYMLQGGPKVKLPGCKDLVDDKQVHVARITRVISDKMTEGQLVE